MHIYRDRQTGKLVTLRKDETEVRSPRFFAVDMETYHERQIFSFNELVLIREVD